MNKMMNLQAAPISALYLHIPFCHSICPFCAFTVRKDNSKRHLRYLELLHQEMQLLQSQYSPWLQPLESIYIGGGTPSCLSLAEIEQLVQLLFSVFQRAPHCQFSIELNPEDVSSDYVNGLALLGVNRISLGLQSFNGPALKSLGRQHTAQQSVAAMECLQKSVISNFNADLMFGFPQQSVADFQQDLNTLLTYEPPHVSLYCLEVHAQTPFGHQDSIQSWSESHQDAQQEMYLWAIDQLHAHGIEQYEVSNFARAQHQGRTNQQVWSGGAYLGIGTGAHSYWDTQRWSNHAAWFPYEQDLMAQKLPLAFHEHLSPTQQANEALMLALRQPQGLNIEQWQSQFQVQWTSTQTQWIETLCQQHYAHHEGPLLSLTPKGLFMADGITTQFML